MLHQVLTTAVEDNYLRSNPSDNVLRELKKEKEFEAVKHKALTIPEQNLFLNYLKRTPKYQHWYPIFAVMMGTGLRVGEATGLRWCDINLKERTISVNHTLVNYDHRETEGRKGCYFNCHSPKTEAGKRMVPMIEAVREAFLLERAYQKEAELKCTVSVDERLPEEGRFHLSTLMIPTDREETLNVIRARLRNGQVCRVVSTSLVEAGVDVDFPSVWRELAGLDSILQAAGRCNREGKRSAAESVVHVFEAEGTPPHAMIQQREATTKVMGEFEEINTRPAIRAYFDRLLWVKGDDALDEKQILNSERACTFRKTAEAFRLIDADTCTVYVPNEGNAEDIAQLRAGLYSRALIRRLGRSSVNVHQNEYKNLVFAGIVEDHQEDGFGILIQLDAYKPKCGLSTEAGDGFLAK